MKWWRKWRRADAKAAQETARREVRRLRETRKDWPRVNRAHDELVEWIETALRGQQP